jgi:hypothetical protein
MASQQGRILVWHLEVLGRNVHEYYLNNAFWNIIGSTRQFRSLRPSANGSPTSSQFRANEDQLAPNPNVSYAIQYSKNFGDYFVKPDEEREGVLIII